MAAVIARIDGISPILQKVYERDSKVIPRMVLISVNVDAITCFISYLVSLILSSGVFEHILIILEVVNVLITCKFTISTAAVGKAHDVSSELSACSF